MKFTHTFLRALLPAAIVLAAGILPSQAASILTNGDFEVQNPQLATNGKINTGFSTLTGWNDMSAQSNPDSGIQGSGNNGGAGQQAESGSFFVFEQGGKPGAYQITGTTLTAGAQLTLTWWALNSYQGPVQQINLLSAVNTTDLYNATSVLATADSSTNPAYTLLGNVYTQYTLNYTVGAQDAGKFVGVSFSNVGPGGSYLNLDNFSLTLTPAPEPSTYFMILSSAIGIWILRLRRRQA